MFVLLAALVNPYFGRVMAGRRFEAIKSKMHFYKAGDEAGAPPPGDPLYDRTMKVRVVLDKVFENTRAVYQAGKYLSMDEGMTACKCRSFQYR